MKRALVTGYTFTASTKTLDFSSISGFNARSLVAVINVTQKVMIYGVGITGKGYTSLTGGNVFVLQYDVTSHDNSDILYIIYDDIGGDATNGLDVDVTRMAALVAGSAIIGKVGIDQTTPGVTNAVSASGTVNVSGTVPVSGTVGVSGTVPVSGTVGVSGTIPVSGTVGISGTVPISGTVGISGTVPVSIPGTPTTQLAPSTSGGLTAYRDINAGTAGSVVKNSAGQLYGYYLANTGTVTSYIKVYDKSSAPGTADTPVLTLAIPGTAAANTSIAPGIQFSNGIGVRATTGAGDTDATAPAGTTTMINLWYK